MVKVFVVKLTFGAVFEPLSVRVAVNVAVPLELGSDWKVKLPVVRSMVGAVVKVNPPVEPVCATFKLTSVWLDSFAGPALMAVAKPATVCAPAFSAATGLAPRVKVGASLTKLTVIVKDCVLLLTFGAVFEPLSVSVALKVAVPLVSGAA